MTADCPNLTMRRQRPRIAAIVRGVDPVDMLNGVAGAAVPHLWAQKWNNPNSFNSNRATFTTTGSKHFLPTVTEVEYDGTNYYYRCGHGKGGAMREFTRFAQANFFTTKADQIGIFLHAATGVAINAVCTEFYRIPVSVHF